MSDTTQKIRILIVEDAIDQAMLLRGILGGEDHYEVEWAQDGGRALEMFGEGEFDVVLTDLNLPGMDGFDLTRELKRISKVPVVAITGYTHQSYFESAYRAGADGLIQKPVMKDEIIAKLKELVPDLHPRESEGIRVFALSALPGDAIAAVGGTLVRHVEEGAEVLIFVLNPADAAQVAAANAAAELLGARLITADAGDTDPLERQLLMERVVRDFDPHFAYVPALADDQVDRREAHRLARPVLGSVKTVLHYGTATSTLEFKPTAWREIGRVMARKVSALDCFAEFSSTRPDLSSRFAQASARYWGRYRDFSEVEPFEISS